MLIAVGSLAGIALTGSVAQTLAADGRGHPSGDASIRDSLRTDLGADSIEPPRRLRRGVSLFDERLRLRLTTRLRSFFVDEFVPPGGNAEDRVDTVMRLRLRAAAVPFASWPDLDLYADGRGNLRWRRDRGDDLFRVDGELTEAWVRYRNVAGVPLTFLKVGRSRLSEQRGFWWSEEFESVRAGYESTLLFVDVGSGGRLSQGTIEDDGRRDLRKDLLWWFGTGSFQWYYQNYLELRFLHQEDQDTGPRVGAPLPSSNDPIDEDATWLGARAIGELPEHWLGTPTRYWLDLVGIVGSEVRLTPGSGASSSLIASRNRHSFDGLGLDLGASVELPLPFRPTVTLGYALGSSRYRQPDMHRNKGTLGGIQRFRFYGETLRPELSNLEVLTVAVASPIAENVRLELVYHRYRSRTPRATLRDQLRASPDGSSRSLGDALDAGLELHIGDRLRFELIGGFFRAGVGYGPAEGDIAYRVTGQVRYEILWSED